MEIGFIGLGNMGGPMAANLLKAGHSLTVFDLSKTALQAAGHAVQTSGDGLLVPGVSPEQVGVIAGDAGVYLSRLAPQTRSLEQAFLALTGEGATA